MFQERTEDGERASTTDSTEDRERAAASERTEERAISAESTKQPERAKVNEGTAVRERVEEAESAEQWERRVGKWERLWTSSSPEQALLLFREAVLAGERVESVCGLLRATSFGPAVVEEGHAAGPENGSQGVAEGCEPAGRRAPKPESEPTKETAPSDVSEPHPLMAPKNESEPSHGRAPKSMSADFGEPE